MKTRSQAPKRWSVCKSPHNIIWGARSSAAGRGKITVAVMAAQMTNTRVPDFCGSLSAAILHVGRGKPVITEYAVDLPLLEQRNEFLSCKKS